jgi:hypothetical protein
MYVSSYLPEDLSAVWPAPSLAFSQDYQGGEFKLYFANCQPDSAVDFTVRVSLYNVRGACLWQCGRGDEGQAGNACLPGLSV